MTFSDKRIVDFVTQHFIPVWESVAPVSTATFELGDGRVLKGTVGGEIAVFFCLPDGRTFDILPALQSPNITLRAIQAAKGMFDRVAANPDATVPVYHASQVAGQKELPRPKAKESLAQRLKSEDAATRALTRMAGSKTAVMSGDERFVVIEPSGLDYYAFKIHHLLAKSPLKSPQDLKVTVFEGILEMKLEGRHEVFTTDSAPEPFMYVDEDP